MKMKGRTKMQEQKAKIVLAYSGGLDTSVAIKWIQEQYDYDVIACSIDLGESKDITALKAKAEQIGAIKTIVLDCKQEFAEDYILPALYANALYEGKYPLSTALGRPLIVKKLVEVVHQENAIGIAHGCTGKGNDQVRLEVGIRSLDPNLKIIGVIRDWGMSREEEIAYAQQHNIPIPVKKENPFSIDANIWGRSCEGGVLEDPWEEPPEDAYIMTNPIEKTPSKPDYIEIEFNQGCPVKINGESMSLVKMINVLNEVGGKQGVGRINHIENRLVGIKSREIYENPAAVILINAHKELEFITLPRDVINEKVAIERRMANLIYDGLWFSPLFEALAAFVKATQRYVNGKIRVKLFKGSHTVIGHHSINSLYNEQLATYTKNNLFDHKAAAGFIHLWGLSSQVFAEINKNAKY